MELETGATPLQTTIDHIHKRGVVLAEWFSQFVVWNINLIRADNGDDVWDCEVGDYFRFGMRGVTREDAYEKALNRYRERAARL